MLVFHGRGGKSFELVEDVSGPEAFRKMAARGASTADVDRDGRLDLFVLSLPAKSPAALLLNRTENTGHRLELDLRNAFTGATTLGAKIEVRAEGRVQHFQVTSGGSYLSSSATPTHAGLGAAELADVEVHRAYGKRALFRNLRADRRHSFHPGPR